LVRWGLFERCSRLGKVGSAAGTLPAADATPSGRRPLILPGILVVVAALKEVSGAAPAPLPTGPDLLAHHADDHIAATGLLRVAGRTRLSKLRLLGGVRAPSQWDLAGPLHLAALERLRAPLPDNVDLALLASCHGVGAGLWRSALSAPAAPPAPSVGGPCELPPTSGWACPLSPGRRRRAVARAALRWTHLATTS